MMQNTRVILAKRPEGAVDETCFRIEQAAIPSLGEGQVLVRSHWLSLDPYMRRRMDEARSYAPSVAVGATMIGGAVGEIVESRSDRLPVGTFVVGPLGWQAYAVADPSALRAVDPARAPLSTYLGVLGMPGVTAWIGLLDFGSPKPGETVVVSAAAGAVGSVVGQLARLRGCRAVGIAGGPAKCAHVVDALGFDACVDHRAPDFEQALERATPHGIDVDFENVGGRVMDAVFRRLNQFARVPLCGLVAQYDRAEPEGPRSFAQLLSSRVSLRGFIVTDHMDRWPAALEELARLVREGELRWHETIAHGLESAPRAFIGMLRGENLGKQLVRLV